MKLHSLLLVPLALVPLALPCSAQRMQQAGVEFDRWSQRIVWKMDTGGFSPGVHATLMPDGETIVVIGFERQNYVPSFEHNTFRAVYPMSIHPLGEELPAQTVVQRIVPPLDASDIVIGNTRIRDDLFCGGMTLTADGRYFTAGGLRKTIDLVTGVYQKYGLTYGTILDLSNGVNWRRIEEDMKGLPPGMYNGYRWYPTTTRLPDGNILVSSGFALVHPVSLTNTSVELFDVNTETWTELSDVATSPPEILNSDYTHVFVLPEPVDEYDVLMIGEPGMPLLFSTTSTPRWREDSELRGGALPGERPNFGASSLLLPIRVTDGEWGYSNGSMMVVGGDHFSTHQHSADIYDPVLETWLLRKDIVTSRHHPSTVNMPDGRILIVAGHDETGNSATSTVAYIDPANGFAVTHGNRSSGIIRGYHTVSLLLPDGRVLVGGGQHHVTWTYGEKANFQYYYPPYMFEPRPSITAAPSQLTFGQSATIETQGPSPTEVVLIALGSMTHSIDMNQRYVQMEVESIAGGTVVAKAPPSSQVAPSGHYMLFVLDAGRVPSKAQIVHLGP